MAANGAHTLVLNGVTDATGNAFAAQTLDNTVSPLKCGAICRSDFLGSSGEFAGKWMLGGTGLPPPQLIRHSAIEKRVSLGEPNVMCVSNSRKKSLARFQLDLD